MEHATKTRPPPLDSIAENPALVDTLDHGASVEMMGRLLRAAGPILLRFVAHALQECQARDSQRSTDRLLSVSEIAKRLSRSEVSVYRAFKTGQYPFMMKDGGKVVGSENALERWIGARTKHQTSR
jgi:predicted DNA-binding transcriptional regulator AlpA